MAFWADAGLKCIAADWVEQRKEEYDSGRQPQECFKSAREGEKERHAPEYGLCCEVAVEMGFFMADVETLCAEFLHVI